jgi:hypothetical protein
LTNVLEKNGYLEKGAFWQANRNALWAQANTFSAGREGKNGDAERERALDGPQDSWSKWLDPEGGFQ